MQMEEQILEFLDGNLTPVQEEELLHRLAVSPERRTLLRQHLQVREMAGALAKKTQVSVPNALTASVFATVASLGYTGPQPMKPQVAASSASISAAPIASTRSRLLRPVPVLLLALCCLIGGSVGTYLLNNQDKDAVTIGKIASNVQSQQSNTTQITPTTNSTNRTGIANQSGNTPVTNSARNTNNASSHRSTIHRESHQSDLLVNSVDNNNSTTDASIQNSVNNAPVALLPESRDDNKPSSVNKTIVPAQQNNPAKLGTDVNSNPSDVSGAIKNNPLDPKINAKKAYTQPFSFSLRTGGGKVPGSDQGYTGSLVELRGSMYATDWLSFTVSVGQFMPYESSPVAAGVNGDGVQLYRLDPVLNFKNVVGLEVGTQFNIISMPIEFSVGAMTNFAGTVVPRGSIFTSLDLQDNLALRVGFEGAFYGHDVSPALQQMLVSTPHSQLIGKNRAKETDGFFGPAVELFWRF